MNGTFAMNRRNGHGEGTFAMDAASPGQPSVDVCMNELILRLAGVWGGRGAAAWGRRQRALYALLTCWMMGWLVVLFLVQGSAAVLYTDDLTTIASNTCLFVETTAALLKVGAFVWRRGALEAVLAQLDRLTRHRVARRGGARSRRSVARAARSSMLVTCVFLSMGFSTYMSWMVYPAFLGSGIACHEAAARGARAQELLSEITKNSKKIAPEDNLRLNITEAHLNNNKIFSNSHVSVHGNDNYTLPQACPEPIFPAVAWYPFNIYTNPGYTYAFIIQVISIYYLYITTSCIDTFFASIMMFIASQLEILASDLISIQEQNSLQERTLKLNQHGISNDKYFARNEEMKMEANLEDSIVYHQKIIRCVQDFQSVISIPVLIQFFASTLVICMTLYAIASSSGEDHAATVKFGGYFCVMFSEILLYCWFGHNVIEKNEEVCLAAYSCSWYDGSKEFKNRILFIILRTQKTLAFHGGVFYTFSRATFLSLINASYSFFNLLRQVK